MVEYVTSITVYPFNLFLYPPLPILLCLSRALYLPASRCFLSLIIKFYLKNALSLIFPLIFNTQRIIL